MAIQIKDLRYQTGLSQRQFAEEYQIPVSTLRKWEQGESSPPPYVLRLLAYAIPLSQGRLEQITYKEKETFFFDRDKSVVMDRKGNAIRIYDDLKGVNRHNLSFYLHNLFEEFYDIQSYFQRECYYDRKEGIQWAF